MVVFTLKWNKKIALLVILAAAAILCTLIFAIGKDSHATSTFGTKVKTNEDRVMFLQSLGWDVDQNPIEERTVVIPKEFSEVYKKYNQLQLEQGFDLSKYRGMETTLYTYKVKNYPGYIGDVVAELYVVNNEIIGGDIHSLELSGFMHGLRRNSK